MRRVDRYTAAFVKGLQARGYTAKRVRRPAFAIKYGNWAAAVNMSRNGKGGCLLMIHADSLAELYRDEVETWAEFEAHRAHLQWQEDMVSMLKPEGHA